jgi:hypothetical protein
MPAPVTVLNPLADGARADERPRIGYDGVQSLIRVVAGRTDESTAGPESNITLQGNPPLPDMRSVPGSELDNDHTHSPSKEVERCPRNA